MATKFADFMRALEEEARAEGPEAVEQLAALRDHFRLGRQLADARMKRKLTQQQVAKLSRIDQADVSNIERGVANPTLGTLAEIERINSVDDLLGTAVSAPSPLAAVDPAALPASPNRASSEQFSPATAGPGIGNRQSPEKRLMSHRFPWHDQPLIAPQVGGSPPHPMSGTTATHGDSHVCHETLAPRRALYRIARQHGPCRLCPRPTRAG